jgi:hypothetical protein
VKEGGRLLAGSPPGGKSLKPKPAAAAPHNFRKSRRVILQGIIKNNYYSQEIHLPKYSKLACGIIA